MRAPRTRLIKSRIATPTFSARLQKVVLKGETQCDKLLKAANAANGKCSASGAELERKLADQKKSTSDAKADVVRLQQDIEALRRTKLAEGEERTECVPDMYI